MSRHQRSRGQSLVEFALVAPVFFLIVIGLFDVGYAIYAYNTVSNAARSAARVAIVNQVAGDVEAEARRHAVSLGEDRVTVTLDPCSSNQCSYGVTVEYDYQPVTPIIGNVFDPIILGPRGCRREHQPMRFAMINFLSRRWRGSTHPDGQVLVIVAVGMIVFIAMVGVVIDGGHAWGQQRNTQNGTDAAAEAGAIVLAQNLPFTVAGQPAPNTDATVLAAVQAAADANDIDLEVAYYTDFDGDRVPGPVEVGTLGAVPPPSGARGVEATGTRDFETFLAGVMGFDEMTARTDATAISGIIAEAGASTVLPVTFPVTITGCDGQNNAVQHPGGDRWELGEYYVVPLCKGGPGNVGWLDWDPREPGEPDACDGAGNGNAELRCAVRTRATRR